MDRDQTLGDAVEHYLTKVAPNRLRSSSLRVATSTLKMWRRELGAHTRLKVITTGNILEVRDNYGEPATANRVVSVLSSLLDTCVERDWLDVNPCKRIRALRVDNEDTGTLIDEHYEAVLKAEARKVDMSLYTLLCLAFETGARLGELEGLTPQNVDIGSQLLIFERTKNGSKRTVPISSTTADLIEAHGLPGKLNRRAFNKIVDMMAYKVRFHDIRHTMISRALARGIPITTVGRMVGHKTLAMTVRYQHSSVDELRCIVDVA